MKNTKKILFSLIALVFLAMATTSFAQTRYAMSTDAEIKVAGTSTLHDWEMITEKATGQAVFTLENGVLKGIQSLSVTMIAESMKSGKGQMDKNAYKALKTDKNPNIKYTLKEIKPGQGNSWTATGDLTIAGVTKTLTIPVVAKQVGTAYEFSGSIDTKLTDFKIDPPTAMLGTIKTGNDVTLSFSAKFNQSN